MDQIFQLTKEESIYKEYYEKSGGALLQKPMPYEEYDRLNSEIRKYYLATEKFHEPITTNSLGNTIQDVAILGETVKLVKHSRYSLPVMHNHDYVELIYVYSGGCRHFVESQDFMMREGDLCFMTPAAMHAIAAPSDDAIILNIMMSRKLFTNSFLRILRGDKLLSDFFEKIIHDKDVSPYILFPTGKDPFLHETIERMYQERTNKDYLYNEVETLYVKQIFIHLVRHYEMMAIVSNPINHAKETHLVSLIGYITVNYNHVTLKDTAAFFGYNETYLGKMIQHSTGKNFSTLIRELKMQNAKRMLEESAMSITEIAGEVGCYDSSHLTRNFKMTYGISPNAYRRQFQEQQKAKEEKSDD